MPKTFLSENINDILSIARLAPSVHNTQPWKVKADKDKLIISVEKSRQLTHGDPTGRETYISLGIFVESCLIALAALDFQANKVVVNSSGDVLIQAKHSKKSQLADRDVKALQNRFTDRSIYQKESLSDDQVDIIDQAWSSRTVKVQVETDQKIISKCADLTRSGLLLALSSPDFRAELVSYLVDDNQSPQGIPLDTLHGSRILVRQLLASGLSRRREAKLEYKRWLSASGIVFILAEGDSIPFWIEAGRAYLRTSLAIEKSGLAQATSAAIVEAADFHEDIEKILGTEMRLMCLVRVGKSKSAKKSSGRLKPEELLAT